MSVVLRVDDNIIIDYFLNTRNLLFTRVPSFFIVANLNALKLLHECFFFAQISCMKIIFHILTVIFINLNNKKNRWHVLLLYCNKEVDNGVLLPI